MTAQEGRAPAGGGRLAQPVTNQRFGKQLMV